MKNTKTTPKPKSKRTTVQSRKVSGSKNPRRTGLKHFLRDKTFLLVTVLVAGAVGVYYLAQTYALIDPTYPKYEAEIYRQLNVARKNAGKVALKPTQCIHDRALVWARHMANNNLWQHQDMGRVLKQCPNGDSPNYAAETLYNWPVTAATEMTPSKLANSVVQGWLNSKDHKAIMLSSTPNSVGIGVATYKYKDSNGTDWIKWYVVGDYAASCGGACGAVYTP